MLAAELKQGLPRERRRFLVPSTASGPGHAPALLGGEGRRTKPEMRLEGGFVETS